MSEYYAVVRSGFEDTLEHFGVLGMRWGIRHDRRVRAAKALYKTRRREIKKDRSLDKATKQRRITASREQWMKERENAANRLYSYNGKAMNRKIARQSTKKTIAKVALLGSAGSAAYDKMRSKGSRRLSSAVVGRATGIVDDSLLGIPSIGYYAANVAKRKDAPQVTRKKKKK